jgi:hypothetical protein
MTANANALHGRTRLRSDRPLLILGAAVALILVFAGFARTFYLKGVFGGPPLSSLLMAHGVLMSLWVALFATQIGLVANGRIDLHRRLGVAGAVLAVLIVIVNVSTAVNAGQRGLSPTPLVTPLQFMAVPLVDVVVFATLVGTALLMRRRPATHKRLMLVATLASVTPAVARLPIGPLREAGLPAFFGVTLATIAIVIVIDTVRHRRLHPAFAWGGALVAVSVPLRIALGRSDAWTAFAGWLVR